jgi:broad specificity phosphatase PhoE
MNFRKKSTLKAIRITKLVSGYYIVKHSWIWKMNQYWPQMIETQNLVKLLILRGFRFTTEELATIFNVARHGNPYRFSMFESGEYVPSARDIEKVLGPIKFQEIYAKNIKNENIVTKFGFENKTKNILLIRHGESAANAGLVTSDPVSIPLTAKGEAQANQVAKQLPFEPDRFLISSYLRARQTAERISCEFPLVKAEIWPTIREFTYLAPDTCAGTTVTERKKRAEAYWDAAVPDYIDGNGAESFRQFMKRIDYALETLDVLPYKNIVIVSHEQCMRALLMERHDEVFRNADLSEKMRMFHEGRKIANAEMVWLEGIGLEK